MPNTPLLVGEGMSVFSYENPVTASDMNQVRKLFDAIGKTEIVPEAYMDAVVGLSGSGPAYVFMFIEALADGAVACGLTRSAAYKLAAQTVLGSAKMVLETGRHPADLKDMVCSPGGTTIEAVKLLERSGFRASAMEAVIAASRKSGDITKK